MRDIVTRLTNSIALQDRDCCTVDDFAAEFKTTSGCLKTTLKQLEEAGLITITGEASELVVPTAKLLRHQNPHLDDSIWPRSLRDRITGVDYPLLASPTRWRSFLLVPFAGLALVIGALQIKEAAAPLGFRPLLLSRN